MKAPAIQFYIGDWFKDPAVQAAEAATRGAWANLLMFMWESKPKGMLSGTMEQLRKLANCKEGEWPAILDEIKCLGIADITEANGKITIKNRRMYREQKEKENNRIRQNRFTEKRKNNGEITPLSSSSSSSSSSKEIIIPEAKAQKTEKPYTASLSAVAYDAFKKFIELYPKPEGVFEGSAECEAWFRDHQKNQINYGDLLQAVKRYRDSDKPKSGFAKRPIKWLYEWRDWIPKAPPPAAARKWAPTGFIYGPCSCGGTFAEYYHLAEKKTECDKCGKKFSGAPTDVQSAKEKVNKYLTGEKP